MLGARINFTFSADVSFKFTNHWQATFRLPDLRIDALIIGFSDTLHAGKYPGAVRLFSSNFVQALTIA